MSGRRLRAALIGFGKMAQGYAADPAMARHYRYAAHAQVLVDHPAFDWRAVVDPDAQALSLARDDWHVSDTAAAPGALADRGAIEVAVIATPPDTRLDLLDAFPNLRAVLVEKPLGINAASAARFLDICSERNILVQVNLWRRADDCFRDLAAGRLAQLIGAPRAVAGFYGNGLHNNGTHIVDMLRMFFGEVVSVQRLGSAPAFREGPIEGDTNPAVALEMRCGLVATLNPMRFHEYRENGLSLWGAHGRLDILNEGLTIHYFPRAANRAMSGEHEIAADAPQSLASTAGEALYRMYDNLAAAIDGREALWSDGPSALATSRVVEAIATAPADGCRALLARAA